MTDRLKKWIEGMKNPGEQKGMSIVEILVAISIMVTALIGVEASVAAGLGRLKDQQVNRMSGECARIAMEYFSTVQVDKIYEDGGTSGGMNSFVQGANSACLDLMNSGRVAFQYSVAPSCAAYTEVDPVSLIQTTTCYYGLIVDVRYKNIVNNTQKHIVYEKKFFEGGGTTKCEASCGIGNAPGSDPPDRVYN